MKNSKKWSIISLAIGILIFSAYFASIGQIPGLKSSALGSDFMCTQEGIERYTQQYDEDVAQRSSLTADVEKLKLKNQSLSKEIQTLQSNFLSRINQKDITQNNRQIIRKQNSMNQNQKNITKIQVKIDQIVTRINAYESCKALLTQESIWTIEAMPIVDTRVNETENQVVSNNENTISHNSASSEPINGWWIDNDLLSHSHYVLQKSCTNPAPANGGASCANIPGWTVFNADGYQFARTCTNGGINGRMIGKYFWCDPPAGYNHNGTKASSPVNGGWADNDLSPYSTFVLQKSCTNPAPANGGASCANIPGWTVFNADGYQFARTCTNGGINGRMIGKYFWCDPPAGLDDFGRVIPFAVHMKTQLSSHGGVHSSHFPADWTRGNDGTYISNGYFINQTGRDLVLHRMTAYLDAAPFNVGTAAVDVCLFINDQRNSPFGDAVVVTHNEILCTNQRKIGNQWPWSTQVINFPGQGHIVPAGAIVVCDSQAAAEQVTSATVGNFSNFSCVLEFRQVDMNSSLPVVQSIRTPYTDEAFKYTTVSKFTPHVNLTANNLNTYGVWAYTSTKERKTDACLYWGDGTYPQRTCATVAHFPYGETYSPTNWLSFNESIPPGQIMGATCQVEYANASEVGCAFYYMVGLKKGATQYEPLRRNNTIHRTSAEAYCQNAYRSYYTINDVRFSSSYEACISMLTQ